jgi:hypothetical protein
LAFSYISFLSSPNFSIFSHTSVSL